MTDIPKHLDETEIKQLLNLSTTTLHNLGEIGKVNNIQLYNPIYPLLFDLDESNWNNISLNQKYHIHSNNTVKEIIQNDLGKENEEIPKNIFIKYSPLLDPVKYMIGKYDVYDQKIRTLPNLTTTDQECHSKLMNPMNSSYVDNLFYYLSSMMKNKYGFAHGIDFYGSFLGIQDRFSFKIEDDLEYLADSQFFLSNIGKLMVLENVDEEQLISVENRPDSRCNRSKVCIGESVNTDLLCIETIESITTTDTDTYTYDVNEPPCEIVYNNKKIKKASNNVSDDDCYESYESDESDESDETNDETNDVIND